MRHHERLKLYVPEKSVKENEEWDSEVQKLRNYVADTELPLNNDQDEEMSQVVSTVE